MIDFHSHILEGLDDGVTSLNEAVNVVEEAKQAGFNKIISTTHYYPRKKYEATERERKKLLTILKKNVKDIEIFLGNEIFVNSYIDELIKNKEASTINNSKYILFEIPFIEEYRELNNTIINLIAKGYKLILAHPERYRIYQENPKKLEELIDLGVYLQSNYLSMTGFYGKESQKTMELLLKHDMVSLLGSDVHHEKTFYPYIKESIEKITTIIGEEKFKELSDLNAEIILKNEDLDFADYIPIQKTFLGKYK